MSVVVAGNDINNSWRQAKKTVRPALYGLVFGNLLTLLCLAISFSYMSSQWISEHKSKVSTEVGIWEGKLYRSLTSLASSDDFKLFIDSSDDNRLKFSRNFSKFIENNSPEIVGISIDIPRRKSSNFFGQKSDFYYVFEASYVGRILDIENGINDATLLIYVNERAFDSKGESYLSKSVDIAIPTRPLAGFSSAQEKMSIVISNSSLSTFPILMSITILIFLVSSIFSYSVAIKAIKKTFLDLKLREEDIGVIQQSSRNLIHESINPINNALTVLKTCRKKLYDNKLKFSLDLSEDLEIAVKQVSISLNSFQQLKSIHALTKKVDLPIAKNSFGSVLDVTWTLSSLERDQVNIIGGNIDIFANTTSIVHVLSNLLSNAFYWRYKETPITVEFKCTSRSQIIVVSNIGPDPGGDSIYKHGYTTRKSGCGFGLDFCKKLLGNMGGGISHSYDSDTSTTEFKVNLPVKDCDTSLDDILEISVSNNDEMLKYEDESFRLKNKEIEVRVLIVDDESINFSLLNSYLHTRLKTYVNLDYVNSYNSAIEKIKDRPYDLVITDLYLNCDEGNGRDVAGSYLEAYPQSLIYFYTSSSEEFGDIPRIEKVMTWQTFYCLIEEAMDRKI